MELDYRTKKEKANFDAEHANKPFTLTQEQIDRLPDLDEMPPLVPSDKLVPNASRKNRSGHDRLDAFERDEKN